VGGFSVLSTGVEKYVDKSMPAVGEFPMRLDRPENSVPGDVPRGVKDVDKTPVMHSDCTGGRGVAACGNPML
jgi:hypothetical protein